MVTKTKTTWRKVNLGGLGKVITGKTPSTFEPRNFGGLYPFITIPDLKEQRYVTKTERTLSEKGAEIMKNLKLPAHSVILSCLATVGETGVTAKESFTNQQINSIICDEGKIVPEFLYYTFNYIRPRLLKYSGSVYTNISKSKFAEIEIEIPEDIKEQKRIADILSAFDDKIELNNKINQNLEQIAQAIFKEWFVKFRFPGHEKVKFVDSELGKIPEGWEVRKLGEIVKIEYGKGPSTKNLKKNGYPVYGANGIIGYFEKYKFDKSQIIVGCRGVVGSLFKTLPKSSITHNSLIINHADFSEKNYLFMLLKNSNLQSVVGGSAQPQITIKELSQLPVLFAKQDIREKFEKIAENFEQQRLNIIYENQKLASLRDLLLPKLMSGKIRIE